MSKRQTPVGGKEGFLIFLTEEIDTNGNVIASSYEVFGPDGECLGGFQNAEAANEFIDLQIEKDTPRMKM